MNDVQRLRMEAAHWIDLTDSISDLSLRATMQDLAVATANRADRLEKAQTDAAIGVPPDLVRTRPCA